MLKIFFSIQLSLTSILVFSQAYEDETIGIYDISRSLDLFYDYSNDSLLKFENIIETMYIVDTLSNICMQASPPKWINFNFIQRDFGDIIEPRIFKIWYTQSERFSRYPYYGVRYKEDNSIDKIGLDTLFTLREDTLNKADSTEPLVYESNKGYSNDRGLNLGIYKIQDVTNQNGKSVMDSCFKSMRLTVLDRKRIVQFFENYSYNCECRKTSIRDYVDHQISMILKYYISDSKSIILFNESNEVVNVLTIVQNEDDNIKLKNSKGYVFWLRRD